MRAGLAVSVAMLVCHSFPNSIGWAAGWAALGGFEAILVDNGGPYRSRFATIATLMLGGTIACVAAAVALQGASGGILTRLSLPIAITALFCFAATFARVASQRIASTSVIILVIYFVALGGVGVSLRQALWHALAFVAGAAWAAVLSLVLWPVDPFRPARMAVAQCYEIVAEFTATIAPTERGSAARESARKNAFDVHRRMRIQLELARAALGATTARAPTRTIRARNLAVLLETADMLLVVTMRLTELSLGIERLGEGSIAAEALGKFREWLCDAEKSIAGALMQRKSAVDVRAEDGSARFNSEQEGTLAHLAAIRIDARQNIDIASDAVNAVWTGIETQTARQRSVTVIWPAAAPRAWVDAIRSNWTLDSVMMRHALRMMVVGAVDVLLLRWLNIGHGFWLGMTSIIVLQPYQSHTFKRGVERVGGTIAGGILAAVLAVLISSQAGIIAVITATSVLTLATYAVDYAWYCFFLTPTFVLLSLPHLRDWEYSGVRMLTTLLGATVAVAAMRLLWPEREHLEMGKLLARAVAADEAYIRAMLRSWRVAEIGSHDAGNTLEDRRLAERELLAPARRACGLAANDVEESLDRLMLDSGIGRLAARSSAGDAPVLIKEHALTFVTYLRRLTQSVTTLAGVGKSDPAAISRLEMLTRRLGGVSSALLDPSAAIATLPRREEEIATAEPANDVALHLIQRMERQVSILERAAASLLGRLVQQAV
jgi:uncharacterized membrane protein YccC